jgi:hypothetical protein
MVNLLNGIFIEAKKKNVNFKLKVLIYKLLVFTFRMIIIIFLV